MQSTMRSCEMEQPIPLSCSAKQAQHDLSHVEVRHPESCQRVAISEGVKVLLEQLEDEMRDISSMSSVKEAWGTSSWKVDILLKASSRC